MPRRGWCYCGPFRVSLIPPGLLKPYILRLLSERPMHGFELMEEIFLRTGGLWRPGPGAIYPTLTWLEEHGYVETIVEEGVEGKVRRPYRLTAKGQDALKDYAKFREEWARGIAQVRKIWT